MSEYCWCVCEYMFILRLLDFTNIRNTSRESWFIFGECFVIWFLFTHIDN